MMLFDHGAPGPDGRVSPRQRREADVNIEFQANSKMAKESMALAFAFKAANEVYATAYPAAVGPHMSSTDSNEFMDFAPAISVREAERGSEIGGGWDPHGHTPSDVFTTYDDADFRLGLKVPDHAVSDRAAGGRGCRADDGLGPVSATLARTSCHASDPAEAS